MQHTIVDFTLTGKHDCILRLFSMGKQRLFIVKAVQSLRLLVEKGIVLLDKEPAHLEWIDPGGHGRGSAGGAGLDSGHSACVADSDSVAVAAAFAAAALSGMTNGLKKMAG